jgi:hypothetical protein
MHEKSIKIYTNMRREGCCMGKGHSGVSSNTHSQSDLDHYSNQNNPNSEAYKENNDNHSDQLNPNNEEYKGK